MSETTPTPQPSLSGLVDQLEGTLREGILSTLEVTTEQANAYAQPMAQDLAAAISAGDDAALDEIEAQGLLLAERHRLNAARVKGNVLATLTSTAASALTIGLGEATKALTGGDPAAGTAGGTEA
ncbi:MAG: hypothetical protein ACPGVG_16135 [Mycobacterium sp.]